MTGWMKRAMTGSGTLALVKKNLDEVLLSQIYRHGREAILEEVVG